MYTINIITLSVFISIVGLIESIAFDCIGFLRIKPDILLITVVFFSLSCTRDISIKSAIIAGLFKDIMSASTLGSYTSAFLLLALFLNLHQRMVYREAAHTQVMINFASHIIISFIVIVLGLISAKSPIINYYPYSGIILKGAFYTGIAAPLVFFIFSRLLKIHLAPAYF